MAYEHAGDAPVYAPNSQGRPYSDVTGPVEDGWYAEPPVHSHVVDRDPTLGEQLFHVAVGEPEPEVPTHREDDDLGREPEPGEYRIRDYGYRTRTTRDHPTTFTGSTPAPTQQSPARIHGRNSIPNRS